MTKLNKDYSEPGLIIHTIQDPYTWTEPWLHLDLTKIQPGQNLNQDYSEPGLTQELPGLKQDYQGHVLKQIRLFWQSEL